MDTTDTVRTAERLINKGRQRLRDRAIVNAKKRIALAGRTPDSFTEGELETVVREEEVKLIERLKKGSLVSIAIALGIH